MRNYFCNSVSKHTKLCFFLILSECDKNQKMHSLAAALYEPTSDEKPWLENLNV